jgi:thiosulfate/3-mercaptopyruvate sulfurtransferase
MKYNGHKNVSYLNGGLAKWTAEKRPVTGDAAKVALAKYKTAPDESIRAESGYVAQNLKNPKVAIVDVRAADEYSGTNNEMRNKRTGHMPGAVNLPFDTTNLNNDGTFKSAAALKAAYEAKGITKDKEIIVYCEGGVRAAHTYFTLKHILGYPKVRNYVGSWGEWSKLDPAKHPAEK